MSDEDTALITGASVDAQAVENWRIQFLKTRHFLRTPIARVYANEMALLAGGGR
jgi:hypothetical protein